MNPLEEFGQKALWMLRMIERQERDKELKRKREERKAIKDEYYNPNLADTDIIRG